MVSSFLKLNQVNIIGLMFLFESKQSFNVFLANKKKQNKQLKGQLKFQGLNITYVIF